MHERMEWCVYGCMETGYSRCVVHVSVVRSSVGRCIQDRRYGLYVRCCAGCSIRPSVRPRRARAACIHLQKCANRFVRLIPRIIKLHSIFTLYCERLRRFFPSSAVVWSVNYTFTVIHRVRAHWRAPDLCERERHRINGGKIIRRRFVESARGERKRYNMHLIRWKISKRFWGTIHAVGLIWLIWFNRVPHGSRDSLEEDAMDAWEENGEIFHFYWLISLFSLFIEIFTHRNECGRWSCDYLTVGDVNDVSAWFAFFFLIIRELHRHPCAILLRVFERGSARARVCVSGPHLCISRAYGGLREDAAVTNAFRCTDFLSHRSIRPTAVAVVMQMSYEG